MGAERKQAAPLGGESWPGAARAAEPGLAGLTGGRAKEQAGGGAPAQGTGQAPPAAAPAFMFGAAAAAPAAPATQAPAQQPAHAHFALGPGRRGPGPSSCGHGRRSGRPGAGWWAACRGPPWARPLRVCLAAARPHRARRRLLHLRRRALQCLPRGAPAPAVGAFVFGGAPGPAQAPQAFAFGGQAGGFGASASAAFGQPPLQVCLSSSDFGCIVPVLHMHRQGWLCTSFITCAVWQDAPRCTWVVCLGSVSDVR